MRALWLVRANLKSSPGGDTTQILETSAALRRHGVTIEMTSERCPDLSRFDVVHLFHLDRVWENVEWCRAIRAAGIPSVLSPIYWPSDEYDRYGRAGVRAAITGLAGAAPYHYLKLVHRGSRPLLDRGDLSAFKSALRGYRYGRRFVLDTVDVLLPNSRAECEQLAERFDLQHPLLVVRNAVNAETFSPGQPGPGASAGADAGRGRGTALCVGRIEPRKNQLMLIRALNGTGMRVRIIGRAGDYHQSYERRCREEAGPEVEFLPWQTPAQLRRWYRESDVHVCPSWYETPGLASLEAACCGCRVVMTEGGSTREYFGDRALYCSPGDPGSIRRAVEQAMSQPAPAELARGIRSEYTWETAALETLAGYDRAAKARVEPLPLPRRQCEPAVMPEETLRAAAGSGTLRPGELHAR